MSDGTTLDDLAREAKAEALVEQDRQSDLRLLQDLLDERHEIGAEHYDAFDDMLDRMQRSPAKFPRLSEKQREYAESVAERHDINFARRPSQGAQNVPRGREVPTPAVLSEESLQAALNARKGRA